MESYQQRRQAEKVSAHGCALGVFVIDKRQKKGSAKCLSPVLVPTTSWFQDKYRDVFPPISVTRFQRIFF